MRGSILEVLGLAVLLAIAIACPFLPGCAAGPDSRSETENESNVGGVIGGADIEAALVKAILEIQKLNIDVQTLRGGKIGAAIAEGNTLNPEIGDRTESGPITKIEQDNTAIIIIGALLVLAIVWLFVRTQRANDQAQKARYEARVAGGKP